MANKEDDYNFYTNEELKQKIKNLHLTKRGEKDLNLDSDFNNTYLGDWTENNGKKNQKEHHLIRTLFEGLDLSGANFKNSEITRAVNFDGSNLTGADFRGCIFECKFNIFTNFEGADFRGKDTKYDIQKFGDSQRKQIIFTDEDYEKYQQKLEKENKELKEVNKNTSKQETIKLLEGFKEIKDNFQLEERRWLIISMFSFLVVLALTIISMIDYISPGNTIKYLMWLLVTSILFILLIFLATTHKSNKNILTIMNTPVKLLITKQNIIGLIFIIIIITWIDGTTGELINFINSINTTKESLFNFENLYYIFIPFSLGLFSFIYFSICQYSKAKELRIENQNKIALLHGFQAINSNELIKNKEIFHQNIADVVFTKAYMNKNSKNLPIDKIIDLIKLSK